MDEEQTVILEAIGERRMKDHDFVDDPNYNFPICEMPLKVAKRILDADQKGRKHQESKIDAYNKRLKNINAKRLVDGLDELPKRKLTDEPNHVNFRIAKKLTAKAKDTAKTAAAKAAEAQKAAQEAAAAEEAAAVAAAEIPDAELPKE